MELLQTHGITALCDVRSDPYSRFMPQYNRESLKEEAARHRIALPPPGTEWGREAPIPPATKTERSSTSALPPTEIFQQGLGRLRKGMETHRVALMCAEKEPAHVSQDDSDLPESRRG